MGEEEAYEEEAGEGGSRHKRRRLVRGLGRGRGKGAGARWALAPSAALAAACAALDSRPVSAALACVFLQGEAEEGSAVLEGTDGLTQFELLEASAPTQALPGGPLGDSLNRQTLAFVG